MNLAAKITEGESGIINRGNGFVGIAESVIQDSTLADSTRQKYLSVINDLLVSGTRPDDHDGLRAFAESLSDSKKSFLKAVIAKWGHALVTALKAQATPESVAQIQAVEMRIQALSDVIRVKKTEGQKANTWLTKAQVSRLYESCNEDTNQCFRDRVTLALLVGTGLRRSEAAKLTYQDFIEQPSGDTVRVSIHIKGKGAKLRTIPISESLWHLITAWGQKTGAEGYVLRAVDKSDNIGESLGESAIFRIVNDAGKHIGKASLAPHDLRRTYAQIGLSSGVAIPQISQLLGHASVTTTQRYLEMSVDLTETIGDFIPVPSML